MKKIFIFLMLSIFFVFLNTDDIYAASCAAGGYTPCPSWNPSIDCPKPYVDCGKDGNSITNNYYYCEMYTSSVCCLPTTEMMLSCSSIPSQKICSSDKLYYQTLNYKCTPKTDPDGTKDASCELSTTGPTTYCNPGKECAGNVSVSYATVCQGSGNFTDCVKQYYNPPVTDNCSNKNFGACGSYSSGGATYNLMNTTYSCATTTGLCVPNTPTYDNCISGKWQCSTDNTGYTYTAGTKCQKSSETLPNSASCVSDGTTSSSGKCTSTGSCAWINDRYQATKNSTTCSTSSKSCIGAGIAYNNCNPATLSCGTDIGSVVATPAQTCSVDPNTDPATGTHGQCHDSTVAPTVKEICKDKGYQCINNLNTLDFHGEINEGSCDDSTKSCINIWKTYKTCDGSEIPWVPTEIQCSGVGIIQEMGNKGCILPNGPEFPTACDFINKHPKLIQDCPLHCIKAYSCGGGSSGSTGCDSSCMYKCINNGGDDSSCKSSCCKSGDSGDVVIGTMYCVGCNPSSGSPSCGQWQTAMPVFNCAPANTSTAGYCSGGVQCTLTASYSGQCYDPFSNGSAKCAAPTISVVCSGPCGDNNGPGTPCSTPGGTQQCAGGGSSTCASDGTWSPCECEAGQSLPHSECVDNKCASVNTCGVSDCTNCGCTPPKTSPFTKCLDEKCVIDTACGNSDCTDCGGCKPPDATPHNECVNNVCTSVNTCGTSDCSKCNGCPAGQTQPYLTCDIVSGQCVSVNDCGISNCENCGGCPNGQSNPHNECKDGQCVNVNTCGVNADCSKCGGPVISKCDPDPKSQFYGQCTTSGTGAICADSSACSYFCDNGSKKCVLGGDSGVKCDDVDGNPSDTVCDGASKCNPSTETCGPSGTGILCSSSTECKLTFCDSKSQKCIYGGDSDISCSDDTKCQLPAVGKCDLSNQTCSATGTGKICDSNSDCQNQPTKCIGNSNVPTQCVPDDCGGADCALATASTDCNKPPQCNACKQCVPGGGGALCSTDSDCNQKFTCASSFLCLPDNCGAVNCSDATQCQNLKLGCNSCGQCAPVPNGNNDCSNCKNPAPKASGLIAKQNQCINTVWFNWYYVSANPETTFDFQVSSFTLPGPNADACTNCEIDRQGVLAVGQTFNSQYVDVGSGLFKLAFNTKYFWRIKVYDNQGANSSWQNGPSFTTPAHQWQIASFTAKPTKAALVNNADKVIFTDSSACFSSKACQYNWTFGDGSSCSDKTCQGSTSHTYTSASKKNNPYSATLQLCDNDAGMGCCSAIQPITVDPPGAKELPIWKEISPFNQ